MTLRCWLAVLGAAAAAFGQTQIDLKTQSRGGGGSSTNFVITRASDTDVTIAPPVAGFTNLACGHVTVRPPALTIHLGTGSAGTGASLWPYWDCLASGWVVATNSAVTQANVTLTNGTKGSAAAAGFPIPDPYDDIIQTAALYAGTVADKWDQNPIMDWEANQQAPFYVPGANVTFTRNANGSTAISSGGYVPAPASATASCTAGQFASDTSYFYLCVAPNTWKRAAIGSW